MRASRTTRRAVVPALTALEIESWRLLWAEFTGDTDAAADYRIWDERRRRARPEMLDLLRQFSTGAIDVDAFRTTFDARTKTSWDLFGVRGASGAMFLNKLVKYAPDQGELGARLRTALALPASEDEGHARLRDFVAYLREAGRAGGAGPRHLQPARAAFFVTIWWHLQDPEEWPGFQLSARMALHLEEGLYVPTGDPAEDYFNFRANFLHLATALGRTTWELEYFCWWHQHRERPGGPTAEAERRVSGYDPGRLRPVSVVREGRAQLPGVSRHTRTPRPAEPRPDRRPGPRAPDHTHLQWLLATIGTRLGCRVWIAANDRSKTWNGESLNEFSLQRLPPLGMDADSQRVISLIDVVWLQGTNQVVAAFEIERTSAVYSGLLRMADLAALAPNLNFPLYIVAPAARIEKVRRELLRPTFRMLELDRRCAFFSGEALIEAADNIMRWGNGPGVIERLAERVTDEVGRRE